MTRSSPSTSFSPVIVIPSISNTHALIAHRLYVMLIYSTIHKHTPQSAFILSLMCAASHAHLTGTEWITLKIQNLYYMSLSKPGASAEQVQASSLSKHIRSIVT
jgi:hypothetical protein